MKQLRTDRQEDDPRISYHSRRAEIFPNKTSMDSIQ